MNAPEVVRRYAVTLLEAADETGVIDVVQRDVEQLIETVRQSQELAEFLVNPLIGPQIQASALEQIFSGKVGDISLNFLQLMATRGRAAIIETVLESFLELVAERAGVVRAEVRAVVELSSEQQQRLQKRLEQYTGKVVQIDAQVDASVRGGIVARVGDTVFDGSVSTHLERLRKCLVG